MDWNKNTISSFITFIKERPAMWDSQSPDYRNKQRRRDAAKEVAMLMGITAEEVHKKWTILKNQFSREKRKMGMSRTDRDADSWYKTKWYAYKEMENLMSCNTQPILGLPIHIEDDYSPPPRSSTLSQSSPTPPPSTPTTPPSSPPISRHRKGKKREVDGNNSVHRETVEALKFRREKKIRKSSHNSEDDLTSYGLYIVAHLRKFPPHLQCKARYEINNVLYRLDMESLGQSTTSVTSIDDNYQFSSGSHRRSLTSTYAINKAGFEDD